jgi:Fe2+ transport system protein FeoA
VTPAAVATVLEETVELRLSDVPLKQTVELLRLDLLEADATPLMERGVLPGCRIALVRLTPSGDPVLLVDGTLLALRREVASCLRVGRWATVR